MEQEFWLERWRDHQLGWHRENIYPLIIQYWSSLEVPINSKVFVPLCGKTRDMHYLAELGHQVLGCELSEIAPREFFSDADMLFESRTEGKFVRHQADQISILQGDVFALDAQLLGGTEGVFDRGSLIALPPEMRKRYCSHLTRVLPGDARILLITLEYDQTLTSGPPFSVNEREVRQAFEEKYQVSKLLKEETDEIPPRFVEAGCGGPASPVCRVVWKLIPR